MAGIGFSSTNYITQNGNALGGRTLIVTLTKDAGGNVTEAVASAFIKALGNAGGSGNGTDQNGPDAFTVAAVAGVGTATLTLALQGTGTVGATSAGHTVTTVAEFKDR